MTEKEIMVVFKNRAEIKLMTDDELQVYIEINDYDVDTAFIRDVIKAHENNKEWGLSFWAISSHLRKEKIKSAAIIYDENGITKTRVYPYECS